MQHQWLFERSQYVAYQTWSTMINKEITEDDVKKCTLCQSDTNESPLTLQPFPKDYNFSTSDHPQAFLCQTCLDSIFIDYYTQNSASSGCFIYLPEVDQTKLNFFLNWLKHDSTMSLLEKKGFYAELKSCQERWLDVCGIDISDPFYFKLFYQQHLTDAATGNELFKRTCFLPHFTLD